jgi:hypothetical protein
VPITTIIFRREERTFPGFIDSACDWTITAETIPLLSSEKISFLRGGDIITKNFGLSIPFRRAPPRRVDGFIFPTFFIPDYEVMVFGFICRGIIIALLKVEYGRYQ